MRRLLAIPLLALGLAACGSSSHSASAPSTTASASATTTTPSGRAAAGGATGGCRSVPAPAPRPAQSIPPPKVKLDPKRTYTVSVLTNCGTFAFTLDVKDSPKTSASFYYLARRGFFDGLTFHRIAAGFVIQGGDPTGTGSGGPGYTVVEPPPQNTQYVLGDVAMAKTQTEPSGASGSQFFVVTAENATQSAGLTPDYALVGKVVSGIATVKRIGSLATDPAGDGAPTSPVVMSRVTVGVT